MTATLLPVLAASLLGSVHCAAMCGGFVCLYAGESRGPWAHVAYNAGRLAAYLAVGVVAGVAGAGIERAALLAGVGRGAAIASGLLLVLWGTAMLLRAVGIRVPRLRPAAGSNLLAPVLALVRDAPPAMRAGTIGLLSALLPCGWLYAFAVTAAGSGTIPAALVTMAVFWAGTLPAMSAVGLGMQRITGPLRSRLPVVTAVAVMLIGALSMAGRLATPVRSTHAHTSTHASR